MKIISVYRFSAVSILVLSLTACFRIGYTPNPTYPFPTTFPGDLTAKTVGDCNSGTFAFSALASNGVLLFNPGDAVVTGEIELEMSPSGSYILLYREFDADGVLIFSQTLNDTYSYDPQTGSVTLSQFGVGQLSTENGRYVLSLRAMQALNSPLITARVVSFRVQKSQQSLTTNQAAYCASIANEKPRQPN